MDLSKDKKKKNNDVINNCCKYRDMFYKIFINSFNYLKNGFSNLSFSNLNFSIDSSILFILAVGIMFGYFDFITNLSATDGSDNTFLVIVFMASFGFAYLVFSNKYWDINFSDKEMNRYYRNIALLLCTTFLFTSYLKYDYSKNFEKEDIPVKYLIQESHQEITFDAYSAFKEDGVYNLFKAKDSYGSMDYYIKGFQVKVISLNNLSLLKNEFFYLESDAINTFNGLYNLQKTVKYNLFGNLNIDYKYIFDETKSVKYKPMRKEPIVQKIKQIDKDVLDYKKSQEKPPSSQGLKKVQTIKSSTKPSHIPVGMTVGEYDSLPRIN